mmetsp:Transcript_42218/g.119804  ORF Transcript_42218/g.119804 Transcript_42218/m.119804 type:complete len:144 (+) Transcript_42218:947-1378(+)
MRAIFVRSFGHTHTHTEIQIHSIETDDQRAGKQASRQTHTQTKGTRHTQTSILSFWRLVNTKTPITPAGRQAGNEARRGKGAHTLLSLSHSFTHTGGSLRRHTHRVESSVGRWVAACKRKKAKTSTSGWMDGCAKHVCVCVCV